jgi:hypothetical protein
MDTQQALTYERLFSLVHEAVKVIVIFKVIDALITAQDETTKQSLAMSLGSLLNLNVPLNRYQQQREWEQQYQ